MRRLVQHALAIAGTSVLTAGVAVGSLTSPSGAAPSPAVAAPLVITAQPAPVASRVPQRAAVSRPRVRQTAPRARSRALAAPADKAKSNGAGSSPRTIARHIMQSDYGWGASQFRCYDNIIMRESSWNTHADNPSSSAYGIPQALPGSKMASAGPDWRNNPATQIKWGLGYVRSRYGTPCGAWGFKHSHGWY